MTNQNGASSSSKRFFVGHLFPEVKNADLEKLFSKFGNVENVEIKSKKDIDGKVVNTFAFINLKMSGGSEPSAVVEDFNNLKWKKHTIKVQVAQESFMQRLQREREERLKGFSTEPDPSYNPLALAKANVQANSDMPSDKFDKRPKIEKTLGKARDNQIERTFGKPERKSKSSLIQSSLEQSSSYDPLQMAKKNIDRKMKGPSKKVEEDNTPLNVISFDDDGDEKVEVKNRPSKKVYHSSSDEDETPERKMEEKSKKKTKKKAEKAEEMKVEAKVEKKENKPKKKTTEESVKKPEPESTPKSEQKVERPKQEEKKKVVQRKRYYSSSDDEEEEKPVEPKETDETVNRVEGFDSEFWNDTTEYQKEDKTSKRCRNNESTFGKPERKPKSSLDQSSSYDPLAMAKANVDRNVADSSSKTSKKFEQDSPKKSKWEKDSPKKKSKKFEEDEEMEVDEVEDVGDAEAERVRNLGILNGLLGSSSSMGEEWSSQKKDEVKKPLVKNLMTRYDPENEDHVEQFGKRNDEDIQMEAEENEGQEEAQPEKSYFLKKDVFVKASQSGFSFLGGSGGKEQKESSTSGGFSLLAKFGKADEDEKGEKSEDGEKSSKKKNPFLYDSDSGEEELSKDVRVPSAREKVEAQARDFGRKLVEKAVKNEDGNSTVKAKEPFFFVKDDPRFAEAREFMTLKETQDQIRERFEKERPELKEILKKKLRNKAKKMEKMGGGFGQGIRGGKARLDKNGKVISKRLLNNRRQKFNRQNKRKKAA